MDTMHKIADMLTTPTGTHFLDSGGAAGRHWQHNQGATLEAFQAEPEATIDRWGGVTLSLFHFLANRLTYDEQLDSKWRDFADLEHFESEGWLYIMEEYANHLQSLYGRGCPFETPVIENSYNRADVLSQTIQFCAFSVENSDRTYFLLQIHGGADVRGGYTAPTLFYIDGGDYAFEMFEFDRYELMLQGREEVPEGLMRLDGSTPTPEEHDPKGQLVWSYDTMYGYDVNSLSGDPVDELDDDWHTPDLESLWDDEIKAPRAPDGNGYFIAIAPIVYG